MSANRLKVLELLAQGKISAAEAEQLLDRLHEVETAADPAAGEPAAKTTPAAPAAERPAPKNPRYLRVVVHSTDGDEVNVRVPMALLRTGIRFSALLPEDARAKLEAAGVDLPSFAKLAPDQIVQALAELEIAINDHAGDTVRVFCE